jgi:hypothetical protein
MTVLMLLNFCVQNRWNISNMAWQGRWNLVCFV